MPFFPDKSLEIPPHDVLSWAFGNHGYNLDKPLFIGAEDPSKSVSHNQSKAVVKRLIAGFHAHGLKQGDVVCMHSFNNIYYTLIFLAVIGAGGVFVASNPAYTTHEIDYILRLSNAKFMIVESELAIKALQAINGSTIPDRKVFVLDATNLSLHPPSFIESSNFFWTPPLEDLQARPNAFGCYYVNILLQYGEKDWIQFCDETTAKNTTAALMSTSGTTGRPKAAQISHYALVAQSIILNDSKDKPYPVRRLLCLPCFHGFTAPLAYLAPLVEGHSTYLMKRFHPTKFFGYIKEYGITETAMAHPIILRALALSEEEQGNISSLRFVWAAGAPLDAVTQNKMMDIIHPDAIVAQCWGLTEGGWVTASCFPARDREGSVGRLLPNTEAKIVDEKFNEVTGDDAQGEIMIRGPSTLIGYLDNCSAANELTIDGWLRTGDIGYQRGGKWYIIDRAKELIKVRGWQVSPTELESCLRNHPRIADVAVIGVDFHDGRGELPRAYVILKEQAKDGVAVAEDEIKSFIEGKLAKYKYLDGGVCIVNEIPRNSAGKVLRHVLRKQAKEEIEKGIRADEEKEKRPENVLEAEEEINANEDMDTNILVERSDNVGVSMTCTVDELATKAREMILVEEVSDENLDARIFLSAAEHGESQEA